MSALDSTVADTDDVVVDEAPQDGTINVLEVGPTDTLVVSIPRHLTKDAVNAIELYVRGAVAQCAGVIVLQRDMHLQVLKPQAPSAAAAPTPTDEPPATGVWWDCQGGFYAGVCIGESGRPYHLILGSQSISSTTWQGALEWAKTLDVDGFADWRLPSREDGLRLWRAMKDKFEPTRYWLDERSSAHYAWTQWFDGGTQGDSVESYVGMARVVRRLPLQSFNPS